MYLLLDHGKMARWIFTQLKGVGLKSSPSSMREIPI